MLLYIRYRNYLPCTNAYLINNEQTLFSPAQILEVTTKFAVSENH
jgi:hypothetical protein